MEPEALKSILDKHQKWMRDEEGGERADLSNAVLRYANLSHADLRGADLRGAYLRYADLRYADLSHADLRDADLRHCIADNLGLAGRTLRGLAYPVWTDGVNLSIGCQTHLVHQWAQWTPDSPEIIKMAQDAPAFWAKHKTLIMEFCKT